MARKRTRKRRTGRPASGRPARVRRKPQRRPVRKPISKPRSKARPRKKAKPARSRVAPRVTFIQTRVVTQYRKQGRIVKRGTKGAKWFQMEQQLDRKGRVLRTLNLLSATKVMKTMWVPEEGLSTFMPSGQLSGSLMVPMFESNITTSYAGAKLIEVAIRGLDGRGKVRRIKLSIEPTKSRRMHELVISRIIKAMREAEVRTSYTIEVLRAAKAAGPLKYPLSYDKFRSLEPLTGVEIVITIYR